VGPVAQTTDRARDPGSHPHAGRSARAAHEGWQVEAAPAQENKLSKPRIALDRLKELLSYDPDTGEFIWLVNKSARARTGMVAGQKTRYGYIAVVIDGVFYPAHRLAWFYVTTEWPPAEIDHRDLDKTNNRFANLREATRKQNMQNRRTPNITGSSGYLGVSKNRNKWEARIGIDGKVKHIGNFGTPEEAHAAYVLEKRRIHEFCEI
jgi:HNH endonuclease